MTSLKLSLLTFLAVSSLLLHSSLQARTLPSHYQLLDVSDSIQRAISAVSKTDQQQQETTLSSSIIPDDGGLLNASSFSVPLYSREKIDRADHKDYKSLLLSRLARDAARVRSLTSKLRRSVQLESHKGNHEFDVEDLSTPVVSGISQGSGEYFSQIGIGTPPKAAQLAIDTGSDVTWVQCKPCTDCYEQADPIYDPSASSTYQPLSCSAPACTALIQPACSAGTCQYRVSYGDGSFTTGDFVTETVALGSSGTVPNLAIGCGHDNEGLFRGSAGLLGLGGGAVSFPSQIKARSFSYCLPDRDSSASSTLDFNSATPGGAVTTQLAKNARIHTFYYVALSGLSVGGKPVQIPPSVFQVDASGRGGIIVDSGTAVTRLQSVAYTALRDAFRSMTSDLPSAPGVSLFDTCYDFSSITGGKVQVPTVALVFAGGKSLPLPAKNYLIPADSDGKFCFAFAGTRSPLSIIGNVQQQGIRISYDLANSLVGFSPSKC
uniref:Peptidase A1 domain-containing protein n=1 Tax=Kalanchoe fedtschenkoi TaxID=63787 RepID=A0A7N0UYT4_KALFE